MEGLEVIEQIAVAQVPELTIVYLIGLSSIFVIFLFTQIGFKTIVRELICGLAYLVLIVVLLSSKVLERPTGEYQYKVRIIEDVGYVEFTNKYEVITENDDGTYIVQEKRYIKE